MSTTIQEILDGEEANQTDKNNQEEQNKTSDTNTDPAVVSQPVVNKSLPNSITNASNAIPVNINQPLSINTPQITKTAVGKPINTVPDISKDNMESVRQKENPEIARLYKLSKEYPQLTKDDLQRIHNGENVISVLNKPKELDEKQLDKNRLIGSIGDSIIQLGKMLAVSKGAYIQPSDPKNSLTNYFLKKEDELRNIYRQHQDAYNKLRLNTALQQYEKERAKKEHDDKIKDNRKYQEDRYNIQKQDKIDTKNRAIEWSKDPTNPAVIKSQQNYDLRAQALEESKNYHKISNAIAQQRVNNTGNNNTGKTSSSKKDYYALYAEGINNPDFKKYMDENPNLFYNITYDSLGAEKRNLKGNPSAIGASYEVWKNSHQNNQPDNQSQNSKTNAPAITKSQANDISNIVKKYPNDEKSQTKDIAVYLKNEGYSREEAGAIIKSLQ